MQTYSEFAPTGFDRKGAFLPDQQDWLVVPVSQTRDSGPLAQSNFACALEMLGGESDNVEVHRFGHWGPGWFEIILVNPKHAPSVKTAEEIEASLADYPVLDESDYSKREHEEYVSSWDTWGRSDYTKAIRMELFKQCPEGVSEDCTDEEIEDAIGDLTTEEIDSLRDEAAKKANWEYQAEDSGVTINIKGLAEKTDFDRLADLAIETVLAQRKARDIRALAKSLGADKGTQDKAVERGLVFVSQIKQLMQT